MVAVAWFSGQKSVDLLKGASKKGHRSPPLRSFPFGPFVHRLNQRSQPIGKRFGRLKSDLGFDGRFVFHSLRKTVAHLFETAECPPGVAKDIIGHAKTDMTFGIYSGETRMDHRARWLVKAVRYPNPTITNDRHPE